MKLLIAKEVADLLRVSKARVYELARRHLVPTVTLGDRQVRFEEKAIHEWIAAGGSNAVGNMVMEGSV